MNEQKNASDVPVLLMLFNRPEHTRKVFEKLRESKPKRLFVAANGPRTDTPTDIELCKSVRDIFKDIDWECELHTNFRDVNIGLNPHWYQAMDWFFKFVDRGIILEDDCVPNDSFFYYCVELLERYKDNEQIMHINGSNLQFGNKRGDASYYFSKYTCVWGWATWKRAWQKYDNLLKSYPSFKNTNVIDSLFKNSIKEKKYWMKYFTGLYSGVYNDSATKWQYAIWSNKGFCISPNVNMISNIGHGLSAGNTFFKEKSMGQETIEMKQIIHPVSQEVNDLADIFLFKHMYHRNFFQKAFYVTIKKVIKLFR